MTTMSIANHRLDLFRAGQNTVATHLNLRPAFAVGLDLSRIALIARYCLRGAPGAGH